MSETESMSETMSETRMNETLVLPLRLLCAYSQGCWPPTLNDAYNGTGAFLRPPPPPTKAHPSEYLNWPTSLFQLYWILKRQVLCCILLLYMLYAITVRQFIQLSRL